jgi:hypothetical protein
MTLIVESQYFSPVTFYKISIDFSNIKFDIYEPWQKMSFRNRCVVAGANGPILLSVPLVEGREQRRPMKDIRIDNRKKWQAQHWKTIMSCYNRSPWFSYFCDELEGLYQQSFDLLIDWNRACFDWTVRKLGLPVSAGFTDQPVPPGEAAEFRDFRNRIIPRFINQDFPNPVRYHQVFEDRIGFIPNLSILDLLFCEGKNAAHILQKQ